MHLYLLSQLEPKVLKFRTAEKGFLFIECLLSQSCFKTSEDAVHFCCRNAIEVMLGVPTLKKMSSDLAG